MIEYVNVNDIKPAEYNPRKISEQQIEQLKKSIDELGFCIPIIVNKDNNTIIAGHQRTKSAKAIGTEKVPAFFCNNISVTDEIRFNQIHNGVDKSTDCEINCTYNGEKGFNEICIDDFEITTNEHFKMQVVREMCRLMLRYGNVLCCVVCSGKVILHGNYVKACKLLNYNVNAYILEPEKYNTALDYFTQQYGKYDYETTEKHSYVQGLAQMYRLSNDKTKKQNKSSAYTKLVIPYLNKLGTNKISILDFGCGKGAYIDMLKSKGYNAVGVEFYNNNKFCIDVKKGNNQIDNLISHLKTNGLFDVVVCDSVLNSVDSVEAEKSVLACLSLFCKDDGVIIFSGRKRSQINNYENTCSGTDSSFHMYFLDDNYFTANFRQGHWFYQHFHDEKYILRLINDNCFIKKNEYSTSTSWGVLVKKEKQLSSEIYSKAVDFEFNLPLPNRKRYGRNEDVKSVLKEIGVL